MGMVEKVEVEKVEVEVEKVVVEVVQPRPNSGDYDKDLRQFLARLQEPTPMALKLLLDTALPKQSISTKVSHHLD